MCCGRPVTIRPAGRPRGSQCLARRAVRRDTAVTAESARWSSRAERASRRSAARARRWTRNRASGSAMTISSHLRSLTDRKTHISSVPSPDLRAVFFSTLSFAPSRLVRRPFAGLVRCLLTAERRILSSLPAQTVLTGTGQAGQVSGLPAGKSASCAGTTGGRGGPCPQGLPRPRRRVRRRAARPQRAHPAASRCGWRRSRSRRRRWCRAYDHRWPAGRWQRWPSTTAGRWSSSTTIGLAPARSCCA